MLWSAISEVVLPVYLVIALAYGYGRRFRPDLAVLNRVNMDVFIPCLIFGALADARFPLEEVLWLLTGVTLMILGSGGIAWLLAPPLRIARRTLVPPVMFNNAGNVGIPVMLLTFGEAGLMPAVLILVLQALVQMSLGVYMMDHRAPIRTWLFSPILLAAVGGTAIGQLGITVPGTLLTPVALLGQIASPLMLFSLGIRLVDVDLARWRDGLVGGLLRPVAGLVVYLLVITLLPLSEQYRAVLLVFAVLPPAVMNFMIAERFQQEPATVASMIMLGHVVGAVTLTLGVWAAR